MIDAQDLLGEEHFQVWNRQPSGAFAVVVASRRRTVERRARKHSAPSHALGFNCQACGDYEVTRTALVNWFSQSRRLDLLQSAALSHQVRIANRDPRPRLTSDWLGRPNPRGNGVLSGSRFGLTLDGWERYEAERSGKVAGRYGFIAMKFDDPTLEALVVTTIKPGIQAALGYQVIDVRDVAQAGMIDNIMRQHIRDAAFVLVDLTHDNAGAYWEAGYAEGLGKPVIYLCERTKFDQTKTHFDTNHSTTVVWSSNNEAGFMAELTATLRRSLNLFEH